MGNAMQVALLAGGKGTRFFEETQTRPKPMIEIGGMPILCHIMMSFRQRGFSEFNVALGYKADYISDWFARVRERDSAPEPWRDMLDRVQVNLVDTGLDTNTGGRIKALGQDLPDAPFFVAWGDGVSDVDYADVARFHAAHGKLATMVVVHPPARFGHVELDGDQITSFREKPKRAEGWINGGIFVLNPAALDYIANSDTLFEKEPLENLAKDGQLMAYRHDGYWQCMDTLHDRQVLESVWSAGQAPWCEWNR